MNARNRIPTCLLLSILCSRPCLAQDGYCAHDDVPTDTLSLGATINEGTAGSTATQMVLTRPVTTRDDAAHHIPSRHVSSGGFGPRTPTSGRIRALIVFARFRDDTSNLSGCSLASNAWSDPDRLPDFAATLLANNASGPFPSHSLTAYFHQQSQGRLRMYGDVYPHVVASAHEELQYGITTATGGGNGSSERGMAMLTEEILSGINGDVDFRDYDENGDGYVDYLFIILRHAGVGWTGYSVLGNATMPDLEVDGVRVHWRASGAYLRYAHPGNVDPVPSIIRLMAHEFGHDLWRPELLGNSHVVPLGNIGVGVGVPANGPRRVGYALMAGSPFYDARGDLTISAWERHILNDGWIDCPVLRESEVITLTDLYSGDTSNCRRLVIPEAHRTRTLYLSNRQRAGFFDVSTSSACSPRSDLGLMATGLLVTLSREGRYAVLPADNSLDLGIMSSTYEGDLFGPGSGMQLTPWTRPNISGFTEYPPGFAMQEGNWQAIDAIRMGEGMDMGFDYVTDIRIDPIIRANSWIGAETSGETIRGHMVVEAGATLTIEPGTVLFFASDARITVRGTLDARQVTFTSEGGSWSGIEFAPGGRGVLDGSVVEHADRATLGYSRPDEGRVGTVTIDSFPNPFTDVADVAYRLDLGGHVTLKAFDIAGREVATLVRGVRSAGDHRVVFDGAHLASGTYSLRLHAGSRTVSRTVVLAR